jgi:Ser/Thr protein kinase RdoA (MazF antagonist)
MNSAPRPAESPDEDSVGLPWPQLGQAYGLGEVTVQPSRLTTNGFSGTLLWRVTVNRPAAVTPADDRQLSYIVRRLPPATTAARMAEIYHVVSHVAENGCPFVPVPLRTTAGACSIQAEGHLWQVEPEIMGIANFAQHASLPRIKSAMRALAHWHIAARSLIPHPPDAAPGIKLRQARCGALDQQGLLPRIQAVPCDEVAPQLARFVAPLLHEYQSQREALIHALAVAANLEVPVQICVRDIHQDHLLFADATSDRVVGMVDYDAVRLDCVAADLSRLLRSLLSGNVADWQEAIDCYEQIRPLSEAERSLLAVYDQANCLLSGISWLEWIFLDRRQFDLNRVESRLDSIVSTLADRRFP